MAKAKIKLTKTRIVLLAALIGLVSLVLGGIYFYPAPGKKMDSINFGGVILSFRQDIREAGSVPISPSEDVIMRSLASLNVKNISFAFKDAGDSDNPIYIVEESEIIQKLFVLYKLAGHEVGYNSILVNDSYETLNGSVENPVIALIHPKFAKTTQVKFINNVIYVEGTDIKNFDLATMRMILLALDVKIPN